MRGVFHRKGKVTMPTQEERLAQVEVDLRQFKTETINRYQDIAMQMTMQKGLLDNVIGRLAEVKVTQGEHTRRLDLIDTHLDTFERGVNSRFEKLEQNVNGHFEAQDKKFDQILLLLNTLTPKPDQEA
jgi:hypothetical protein